MKMLFYGGLKMSYYSIFKNIIYLMTLSKKDSNSKKNFEIIGCLFIEFL